MNEQKEKLKEKGNEHFRAKEYTEAISEWTNAIQLDPKDHLLYSNRSMGYLMKEDYTSAAQDAYTCIRLNKQFAKGYFRLGLAFSGMELYTKATEAFSIGVSLEPNSKELKDGYNKAKEAALREELSSITWTERPVLTSAAQAFEMRVSHTATCIGRKVFVFGGISHRLRNDLFILDTHTFSGDSSPVTTGTKPSPRASHCAAAYGKKIYIFGGFDGEKAYYNDLYEYDVSQCKWSFIQTSGTKPSPRSCMIGQIACGSLFVFGGMHEDIVYDDLYALDLNTFVWTKIDAHGPDKRNSHSSSVIFEKYIAVFGGCKEKGHFYNDLWLFDAQLLKWYLIDTAMPPEPRLGHSQTTIDSRIYIFGGLCATDATYRSETFVIDLCEELYPQESFMTKSSTENEDKDKHLSPSLFSRTYHWRPVPSTAHSSATHSNQPCPRIGHSALDVRGRIVIIGGDSGRGLCADLWIGETDAELQRLILQKREDDVEKMNLRIELMKEKRKNLSLVNNKEKE